MSDIKDDITNISPRPTIGLKPVPPGKDDTSALRRMMATPMVFTPGPKGRALERIISKVEAGKGLTGADLKTLRGILDLLTRQGK